MAIHRLYGELATSLVYAVTNYWDSDAAPARAGAHLYDSSQSAFENACDMVAKLGLATDGHGAAIHHWSTEMKLAIDAGRVAQFVADRSRAGQIALPPIDEIIAAWILCATYWEHWSAKRLPFVPDDSIRPVMDALAALGYAKPLGNAFIWTDKIGPAMQLSGVWNENNLAHEELEERSADLEMREALASIPEDVQRSALNGNRIEVVKALATRWIDGAWLPDTGREGPWYDLAGAADRAAKLMELVQGAADPLRREIN